MRNVLPINFSIMWLPLSDLHELTTTTKRKLVIVWQMSETKICLRQLPKLNVKRQNHVLSQCHLDQIFGRFREVLSIYNLQTIKHK